MWPTGAKLNRRILTEAGDSFGIFMALDPSSLQLKNIFSENPLFR
jgi:hypothetical protein